MTVLYATVTGSPTILGKISEDSVRPIAALVLALLALPPATLAYGLIRLAAAIKAREMAGNQAVRDFRDTVPAIGPYLGRYITAGAISGGVLHLLVYFLTLYSTAQFAPGSLIIRTAAPVVIVIAGGLMGKVIARRRAFSRAQEKAPRQLREPKLSDILFIVIGLGLIEVGLNLHDYVPGGPYGVGVAVTVGAVLIARGLAMAAGGLILMIARYLAQHASSSDMQRAAHNVAAEPHRRATGITMMGLTTFMGAAIGAQLTAVVFRGHLTSFQTLAYVLLGVAVLLALLIGAGALIIYQLETLTWQQPTHKAGVGNPPTANQSRLLTKQALIITIPACAMAALAGTGIIVFALADLYVKPLNAGLLILVLILVLLALGTLAVRAAGYAVKPLVGEVLRHS
ncbi:hypothetical protein ABZ897_52840 [Nonomuraea sp. NPDC046802]|uniref:hypothetical protein n=1 Tax=Nonomuraea sp. NPDC046802 TaxID=3154919 RepID=UPI003403AB6C